MAEATASANSTCPRCGGPFHCGADDAAPCPCAALRLNAGLTARLRQRYSGCLCLACLAALAQTQQAGGPFEPPA